MHERTITDTYTCDLCGTSVTVTNGDTNWNEYLADHGSEYGGVLFPVPEVGYAHWRESQTACCQECRDKLTEALMETKAIIMTDLTQEKVA